jgi:hypothetical protein
LKNKVGAEERREKRGERRGKGEEKRRGRIGGEGGEGGGEKCKAVRSEKTGQRFLDPY